MATIYTTKVVYKAVSSQTIYSFGFDYLNKTFVKVKLGGQDLTYLQDYTVDEKTINLTNPPTQGVDLEIYRSTNTEQEVQWEDSSVFRANTLNLFQTQLLHISQEALDGIRKASIKQDEVTSKWDAEGIQINNVGDPQESQDAVNLRYLSNLQDGYITQVEALITNAKNVAEADHIDYLNRFMISLANAQGQADRAESEATRAYNEANRAEGYANTAHDSEILVESYKNTVETLKNKTQSNADSVVQSLSSVRAIEAEMQETLTAEQVNAESVRQEATQALTAITNATTTLDTRYAGAEQFVTEARQIRSEVAVDKSNTLSYKNTATEQAQLAKQYANLAKQVSTGSLDYITDTEAHDTFATKTGTGASGTWDINITGTATKATQDGNGANIADTYIKKAGDTVTGTLNVPTQAITDNSTKVANTAFVQSAVGNKVSKLVNSAPETLDTLNELANALGNDPNFATTVSTQIGNKADKTEVNNKIDLINTNQTELNNKINLINTNQTELNNKINLINTNQTELTGTDEQIKSVLNTLLGTGAWDTPATNNIANIINLLGVGGIVAQRLEDNGYIKFANGLTIQWGKTINSQTVFASKATFPINFSKIFSATGTLSQFTGSSSGTAQNIDDLVRLTLVDISFQFYAHYYIAIGLS